MMTKHLCPHFPSLTCSITPFTVLENSRLLLRLSIPLCTHWPNLAHFQCPWTLFIILLTYYSFLIFWSHHMACRILVPWPGIEPMPPVLEAQSLNNWTTREVPLYHSEGKVSFFSVLTSSYIPFNKMGYPKLRIISWLAFTESREHLAVWNIASFN